ncbi:(R,R)-butanediol dehydrogenase/meso-butanediol dehydrogenase/diacetyl reductase [Pararhizobium capsulatum DSM 1112]|uniref:(R,R)-butanediol dehydrogenase/meso-butanediol dehydrogenase/diacetyl reductase n=1 Tax=Pararhizobium capsulatum DSM 1112 TaxID=1121113 RepID=A0ABU0BZJ2_9HYPH|nr:alcohol dehydrogenase catalytic domain-containing protein [Pararhizobium capsulatum]MDQ0323682.1 (R,R)-butanediol dehydrogenase/meso-butanediol dehydrogenase/diacetyl reductase [Pararhizobium capsulatum DSM 1112]
MKAARLYAVGDIRVEDIDIPGPLAPGWVRVAVAAAGICGSDLHNFRTGQWITRSPSVAGHEFAGVVMEVGAGVSQFTEGDTVVADSRFWCGECPACRSGRHNICHHLGFVGEICDGGFAEQSALPARLLVRHDPALDPAIAAMAEPLAVALHAVRRQAIPSGEPVLVVGCGPIGGLAALLLSHLHDGPVLVCDRNADRARLVARVTGASNVTLDTESFRDALSGRVLRYALDATGNIEVLMRVIAHLGGGGSLTLVGISHGRIDLDPNMLVEREIALIGCHAFSSELPEAVAMLPGLADALAKLIDREIAIEALPQTYERLLAGNATRLKTIVRFARNECRP